MKTNKTNDLEIIKKDTKNFEPGKVYIRGNGNDLLVTPYSGEQLYDTDSKNFHICPADKKYWEPISEEYRAMREKLKETFEKYFNEIKEGNKKIKDYYPNEDRATLDKLEKIEYMFIKSGTDRTKLPEGYQSNSDMIFLFWGFGKNGGKGELRLYRFLTFFYKGAWYRINFMRMYHDGKYVHCDMNELQYDKDTENDGSGVNKGKDEKFDICYPSSCNAGDFGTNDSGNIVYNPKVSYSDIENDPEKVVTSFLSFVAENSKDENVPV